MRSAVLLVSLAALAVTVAGCSDQSSAPPAATAPEAAPATPPAAPTGATAPAAGSAAENDNRLANEACVAAVAEQSGNSDASVMSSEFSEAATLVMVGVGLEQTPWRCLASNDGVVEEVGPADAAPALAPADNGPTELSESDLEAACLTALKTEAANPDIVILSSEFSEADTSVMLGVGPDQAPWRCLIGADGNIDELSFMGDEDSL